MLWLISVDRNETGRYDVHLTKVKLVTFVISGVLISLSFIMQQTLNAFLFFRRKKEGVFYGTQFFVSYLATVFSSLTARMQSVPCINFLCQKLTHCFWRQLYFTSYCMEGKINDPSARTESHTQTHMAGIYCSHTGTTITHTPHMHPLTPLFVVFPDGCWFVPIKQCSHPATKTLV